MRTRKWDSLLLAGLLTLGAGLPLVMGLVAGSLEIPRNDDWVYRRIALELAQTGVLALHSVTTMMVGQIVIAQPFLWLSGLQPWAFAAVGILSAVAAVVCSYVLSRQFLPPLRATLATLLLLLFPAYLAYATSFMTDVPAIAAQFACLALGVVALRRRPVADRWLVASAVVGCLAFSIREFAIAAPVSVILAALFAEPRRLRIWALAIGVVCCFALLYLLKTTLPGQDLGNRVGSGSILQSTYALSTLSLVLLPAALMATKLWRRHWKAKDVLIGLEVGLLIVGIRIVQGVQNGAMPGVLMGNLASPWGAPAMAYVIGGRPLLFEQGAWSALAALALVATAFVPSVGAGVLGMYLRGGDGSWRSTVCRLGSPIGLIALYSLAVAGGLALYGIKFPLFDRYYWPLVPVAATLLMYRPAGYASLAPADRTPTWRDAFKAWVIAIITVLGVVSLIFMLNSFAFDSARWRAGNALVELGVRPDEIDAGYEWVGFYQPSLPQDTEVLPTQSFYELLWPGRRECGIVSSSAVGATNLATVGTLRYFLFLVTGPEEMLHLYRVTDPGCASG